MKPDWFSYLEICMFDEARLVPVENLERLFQLHLLVRLVHLLVHHHQELVKVDLTVTCMVDGLITRQ